MAFDYESKIAALLTKAENEAATPAEAEAATAMAEKLMAQYAITRAQVASRRASQDAPEEIVTDSVRYGTSYHEAYVMLATQVVRALGNVRCYTSREAFNGQFRKHGHPLYIVGYKSDVDQAKLLIESLQLQSVTALGVWWKDRRGLYGNQSQKLRARREFIRSFGGGASERIRKSRAAAMDEAESSEPGTALVVRNRSQAVDEHMASLGLSRGRARSRKVDAGAAIAGAAAGRVANTGDRPIGGGRTAIGR